MELKPGSLLQPLTRISVTSKIPRQCRRFRDLVRRLSSSAYCDCMRARVPASSANLGPGFDTLAVAVNRYVEVSVEPAPRLSVRSEGEGAGMSDDARHLAARVAMDVVGHDRLSIVVRSQIPVARGLGSSAALAMAAAAAAGSKDPLAVAARIEGHPDNAAASTLGGLVAATTVKGRVRVVRLAMDPALKMVAIVADRPLPTFKARQALPTQVSRDDAAFNLGRMGLLIAGLADHRLLLREATEDRLHQDYRAPLFPEAPHLLSEMLLGGALAVCWSGAGPTLIGFTASKEVSRLSNRASQALHSVGISGKVLVLEADTQGLVTGEDARLSSLVVGDTLEDIESIGGKDHFTLSNKGTAFSNTSSQNIQSDQPQIEPSSLFDFDTDA